MSIPCFPCLSYLMRDYMMVCDSAWDMVWELGHEMQLQADVN
jgi:hypothetical protein